MNAITSTRFLLTAFAISVTGLLLIVTGSLFEFMYRPKNAAGECENE